MSEEIKTNGNQQEQPKKKKGKKWILAVVAIFIIIAIASAGGGDDEQEQASQPSETPATEMRQASTGSGDNTFMYAYEIIQNSQGWSKTLSNLGQLFQNPQLGNSDWIINVAAEIATMRQLADEAEQITPPKKFAEVHDLYMKGIKEFKWMADNLPTALDNSDVQLMKQCLAKLNKGNEYINQATKKMNELKDNAS